MSKENDPSLEVIKSLSLRNAYEMLAPKNAHSFEDIEASDADMFLIELDRYSGNDLVNRVNHLRILKEKISNELTNNEEGNTNLLDFYKLLSLAFDAIDIGKKLAAAQIDDK